MIKRFKDALQGIAAVAATQFNFRFHLTASVFVSIAGFYFKINRGEWIAVLLSIGLVMITETINTSIEFLADAVTKERREDIRKVKDVAAGAVLIAAIVAAVIGIIIFAPKIYFMFWN